MSARSRTAELLQFLVVYDEPQVALLKSSRDHDMLAVAVERPDMMRPFFGCEVREKSLNRYFEEKADLHYVFHEAIGERYYFFDLERESANRVTLEPAKSDDATNEKYWPQIGFFARSHTNPFKLKRVIQSTVQKFKIDGKWGASDFSHFHGKMSDLYGLFAALNRIDANAQGELARIKGSIQNRFWQGGGSYVGFYDDLLKRVKSISPLDVASIQYSSPGEIRLSGDQDALSDISRIIDIFELHDHALHQQYLVVYNALRKDGLLRAARGAEFSSKALEEFVSSKVFAFANSMKIEKVSEIFTACDENIIIFAKVILSIYRRANELYAFHAEGRVQSPPLKGTINL